MSAPGPGAATSSASWATWTLKRPTFFGLIRHECAVHACSLLHWAAFKAPSVSTCVSLRMLHAGQWRVLARCMQLMETR